MKKLSLIPIALIVLVGAIGASSIITPDKPGFPSLPNTPGTLGYVLSLFGADGTAPDSLALWWRTMTGYIQKSWADCTSLPGGKWRWFNNDGTVRCETIWPLLAIGRFSELYPGMTFSNDGGATWAPANTTDILYEWYLVRSNASWTGTIEFLDDDSIIRMDTNTLVQLERWNLGGNTVAQAIVNDGRLWWRILTSTGVNLGGGGLIAWVRGTSVSVEKDNLWQYRIYVIDSRTPLNAATLKSTLLWWPSLIKTVWALYESSYQSWSNSDITSILNPYTNSSTSITRATYLTTPWIRENTKRDLIYMDTIAATNTLAREELSITEPANIEESKAICSGVGAWYTPSNECRNILWYAEYSISSNSLSHQLRDSAWNLARYQDWPYSAYNSWIVLSSTVNYILYATWATWYNTETLESRLWSSLTWKTIKISLSAPVWSLLTANGINWWRAYIADFWSVLWWRYYANSGVDCDNNTPTPWRVIQCRMGDTSTGIDITWATELYVRTLGTTTIQNFIIWNTSQSLPSYWTWDWLQLQYSQPIGTTIKWITIYNF